MFYNRKVVFQLALSVCAFGASCHKSHSYTSLDSNALMQIVRSYNPNNHAGHVLAATRLPEPPKVSPDKLQTELEYQSPIKQYFSQGNYDQLEKTIKEAREGKGRVVGGSWKVLEFYFAIHQTFLGA